MKKIIFYPALVFSAFLSVFSGKKILPGKGENQIAFIGVNVISMKQEEILKDQTVITEGDRIIAIGPRKEIKVSNKAIKIDCAGKFLIPGLADMHSHIADEGWDALRMDNHELLLNVANGVTTIRNMKGSPKHLLWRKEINEGKIIGPTLFTASPKILGTGDTTEVKKLVDEYAEMGYDFIKVYSPPDWTEEAYKAMLREAAFKKIKAIGHFPRNLSIETALFSGQASVDHMEEFLYTYFFKVKGKEFDTARLSELTKLTKASGIYVSTTFSFYNNFGLMVNDSSFNEIIKNPDLKYVPKSVRDIGEDPNKNSYRKDIPPKQYKTIRYIYNFQKKILKSFYDAGVPITLGTDASWNMHFAIAGFAVHDELREMVSSGLTPFQALRTATVIPAQFLGIDKESGTIDVNKKADLVLLNANPLEDIKNSRSIEGVMLRGKWLPKNELEKMLKLVEETYKNK